MKNDQVLLAQRPGGPDASKWNGLGGTMKTKERAHEAAKRLAKAAVGLTVDPGEPLGTVTYHHPMHGHWDVTVFRSQSITGTPKKTKLVRPQWFAVNDLPFKEMWPGDHLFMYRVLEEKPFTIDIWFDEAGNIAKQQVEFV
ncbi:MAG: NUDIX domain-containing protein [Candidatus Kerfeldbacteria bacterium]|nr:NUDIX domain-containing protein [Candidatus Kerfeldbacteria bacterium]